MGKITKNESKHHEQAQQLVKLQRDLKPDEIEFCYSYWTPLAATDVTKGGAFFTPQDLAYELNLWSAEQGRVLDLAAGIGMLSWQCLQTSGYPAGLDITCVEINEEYVRVGRKLLPQATWVHGNIFSLGLMQELYVAGGFTCVISNPPFGNVPTAQRPGWLSFKGPAHLMAAEVAIRMGQKAVMIMPSSDVPWTDRGRGHEAQTSRNYEKWHALFPDVEWGSCSIDTSVYDDQWNGAKPKVELLTLEVDDPSKVFTMPVGLPEEIPL